VTLVTGQFEKSIHSAVKKPFDLFFSLPQRDALPEKLAQSGGQGQVSLHVEKVGF
jgi:hypothetical protein